MSASLGTRESPEVATADATGFTGLYDRYYRDVYRYVAGRLGVRSSFDVKSHFGVGSRPAR